MSSLTPILTFAEPFSGPLSGRLSPTEAVRIDLADDETFRARITITLRNGTTHTITADAILFGLAMVDGEVRYIHPSPPDNAAFN